MIRAIFLDVDGTLVDSNDAHAHAFVQAFAAHGLDIPFTTVRPLIGMGGDDLIQRTAGLADDDPRVKEIGSLKSEIFKSLYLPQLKAFPDARTLLERLRSDGITLIAASSANEPELVALLQVAGALDLIDGCTSASDVRNSKPAPDIIVAALSKARCGPQEALLLGDTPYDIQAARAAGVDTIALRCGGWSDAKLSGALALVNDPSDLLAQYENIIVGQNNAVLQPVGR